MSEKPSIDVELLFTRLHASVRALQDLRHERRGRATASPPTAAPPRADEREPSSTLPVRQPSAPDPQADPPPRDVSAEPLLPNAPGTPTAASAGTHPTTTPLRLPVPKPPAQLGLVVPPPTTSSAVPPAQPTAAEQQTEHRTLLAAMLDEHRTKTHEQLRDLLAEHRALMAAAENAHAGRIADLLAQHREHLAGDRQDLATLLSARPSPEPSPTRTDAQIAALTSAIGEISHVVGQLATVVLLRHSDPLLGTPDAATSTADDAANALVISSDSINDAAPFEQRSSEATLSNDSAAASPPVEQAADPERLIETVETQQHESASTSTKNAAQPHSSIDLAASRTPAEAPQTSPRASPRIRANSYLDDSARLYSDLTEFDDDDDGPPPDQPVPRARLALITPMEPHHAP